MTHQHGTKPISNTTTFGILTEQSCFNDFFLFKQKTKLISDCAKRNSEVSEEMDKSFTDVLAEELKLREEEATTAQRKADVTLLEAKKLSSQYQKEADKCSSGMNTCEEAREKAEAALTQQKRLSALWELRARQQGWKPGNVKSV